MGGKGRNYARTHPDPIAQELRGLVPTPARPPMAVKVFLCQSRPSCHPQPQIESILFFGQHHADSGPLKILARSIVSYIPGALPAAKRISSPRQATVE